MGCLNLYSNQFNKWVYKDGLLAHWPQNKIEEGTEKVIRRDDFDGTKYVGIGSIDKIYL